MWHVKNPGEPRMEPVLNWGQRTPKDQFCHSETSLGLTFTLFFIPPGTLIKHSQSVLGMTSRPPLGSFFQAWALFPFSISESSRISLVLTVDKPGFWPYCYHFLLSEWECVCNYLLSASVTSSRKCSWSALSHRIAVKIHYKGSRRLAQCLVHKRSSNDSHWWWYP